MREKQIKRKVGLALRVIVFGLVALTVTGFATMFLWNWLLPDIFAVRPITFWQALGLLVLGRALFGGFRGRSGGGGGWRRRMREKWQQMTPEERERFRAAMCNAGFHDRPAGDAGPAAGAAG